MIRRLLHRLLGAGNFAHITTAEGKSSRPYTGSLRHPDPPLIHPIRPKHQN